MPTSPQTSKPRSRLDSAADARLRRATLIAGILTPVAVLLLMFNDPTSNNPRNMQPGPGQEDVFAGLFLICIIPVAVLSYKLAKRLGYNEWGWFFAAVIFAGVPAIFLSRNQATFSTSQALGGLTEDPSGPGNLDTYLQALDISSRHYGFASSSSLAQKYSLDRYLSRSKLGKGGFTMVGLFKTVVAAKYQDTMTVEMAEEFCRSAFKNGRRGWFPNPLFGGVVVYPLVITNNASDEVVRLFSRPHVKHFPFAFEFRVLVELSSRRTVFCEETPIWGAIFYPKFQREARQLFRA